MEIDPNDVTIVAIEMKLVISCPAVIVSSEGKKNTDGKAAAPSYL